MSDECNNFIVNHDNFERDFEGMYRAIEDPWNQNSNYTKTDKDFLFFQLLLENYLITKNDNFSVLDIGCANGYHLNYFMNIKGFKQYYGTDISSTIISKAIKKNKDLIKKGVVNFTCDNIIQYNKKLSSRFDVIFSGRTLYYCAPEIDSVIKNIEDYLKPSGVFGWIYNQTDNAFTNQWLTYDLLMTKLRHNGFQLIDSILLNYRQKEQICIALYIK